uniref:gluconokinase n=1 Tax=Gouania willdenowi TaxID=441366 RepID=A0A8C5ELX3_GOUWI
YSRLFRIESRGFSNSISSFRGDVILSKLIKQNDFLNWSEEKKFGGKVCHLRLLQSHQWLPLIFDVRELCAGSNALMTCSALKHHYRRVLLHGSRALSADPHHELLLSASPDVYFLFLSGDTSLIQQRMMERKGHYMKAHMLTSQIKALEPPQSDEDNVSAHYTLTVKMKI